MEHHLEVCFSVQQTKQELLQGMWYIKLVNLLEWIFVTIGFPYGQFEREAGLNQPWKRGVPWSVWSWAKSVQERAFLDFWCQSDLAKMAWMAPTWLAGTSGSSGTRPQGPVESTGGRHRCQTPGCHRGCTMRRPDAVDHTARRGQGRPIKHARWGWKQMHQFQAHSQFRDCNCIFVCHIIIYTSCAYIHAYIWHMAYTHIYGMGIHNDDASKPTVFSPPPHEILSWMLRSSKHKRRNAEEQLAANDQNNDFSRGKRSCQDPRPSFGTTLRGTQKIKNTIFEGSWVAQFHLLPTGGGLKFGTNVHKWTKTKKIVQMHKMHKCAEQPNELWHSEKGRFAFFVSTPPVRFGPKTNLNPWPWPSRPAG